MLEILKKLSKTGNRFKSILDLDNNGKRVLFQDRQLSRMFPEKVCSA